MLCVIIRKVSVALAKSLSSSECHMRAGTTCALGILETYMGSHTRKAQAEGGPAILITIFMIRVLQLYLDLPEPET